MIHGNPVEAEKSEGFFHPSTVRTLYKNPKFRLLFNQLGFRPEARRMVIKSLISIAADLGMEFSQQNPMLAELTWRQPM